MNLVFYYYNNKKIILLQTLSKVMEMFEHSRGLYCPLGDHNNVRN